MQKLKLKTNHRSEMVEITDLVKEAVIKSGIKEGLCTIFSPHTTTGITLFEKVDPSLQRDYLAQIAKLVPKSERYAHGENADAHIKSAISGGSVTVIVEEANIILGPWQGIYFCEYDGPREREIYIKVIGGV